MDVVALGLAKSAARSLPRQSSLAPISSRLRRGTEDVVLAVLGDSTGNESTEWVRLVAAWLAARYPAYTVLHRLWNETGVNYDSATTIQTGTGSKTLTIYNASTSGKNATYSTPLVASQIPVAPHAVILNYGHNSGVTVARADNYTLIRTIREKYPFATVVLTAQNPRGSEDAGYADSLTRGHINIALAQEEGLGLINVFQAFLGNGSYAADWLQVDLLHPNTAGSARWAQEVEKHLADDESTIIPRGPSRAADRIWLSAASLTAKAGTPTRVDTNDVGPLWSFPITGTTTVHGTIDIPSGWDNVNFYALWVQTTSSGFTGANSVSRCRTRVKGLGDPGYASPPQTGSIIAFTSLGDVNLAANNATAGGKKTSYLGVGKVIGFGWGPTLAVEFTRLGDDAADTYIDPLLLLGIMAVRIS